MSSPRILWLGDTRALTPRRLVAEGFTVEVVRRVPAGAEAEVCVVTGEALAAVAAALPRTKIIAVVPEVADLAAALAAGAHDAVAAATAAVELPARARVWARAALAERQLVAGHDALVARARRLEELLAASERARVELAALAHTDELTGLGNRRSFLARLGLALDFSARYGGPLSVVLVELDGLKLLNDVCGHAAVDAALVRIAEIVRGAVRAVDHAARLGGDELGVVLPATGDAEAVAVAERIRDLVGALLPVDGVRLSASLGVADAPVGMTAEAVLRRAGAALHAAKRAGRNRVERAA